ncbi:MAG TPA: efflux RND transporter periplasmic adaptor subunit [Chitinophaga sp.]
MKKKIIRIATGILLTGSIVVVLANNKAKIDKAANPVRETPVVPVKVHEVKLEAFNTSFSINGTTSPAKEVKIASEVQGKLTGLYIDNGDLVKSGQVIAQLDASVYNAQLSSIASSIAKAQLDIDRYTHLIGMGGASQMQLESAKLQHISLLAQQKEILQQIAHMQIRSPFNGKIENVTAELGSYVSFGTTLAQLIDNSSLKINVFLSEQEAFKVKTGDTVSISTVVLAHPKKGYVSMISDKADASGKFLAEISFSNTDEEKLKAGILASVSFFSGATEQGLSIPVSALVASAKEAKVYVANGNKAALRNIKTGIVTTLQAQVLEGLQAGDRVVTSGQLNLENGSAISINQ